MERCALPWPLIIATVGCFVGNPVRFPAPAAPPGARPHHCVRQCTATGAGGVIRLTVGRRTAPQNGSWDEARLVNAPMNMTQLVFGAALGCLLAQGVLYCIKPFIAWLRRDELRARLRALTPPSGRAIAHASIQYAVLLGAAALITPVGVAAGGYYSARRSARATTGGDGQPVVPPPAPPAAAPPRLPAALATPP